MVLIVVGIAVAVGTTAAMAGVFAWMHHDAKKQAKQQFKESKEQTAEIMEWNIWIGIIGLVIAAVSLLLYLRH